MKVEGWLFAAGFFFFAVAAVIYGILAEEPVGTVALAFTARRIDPRPEDSKTAEIAEGAGELGFYSPHSWWPFVVALFAAVAFTGIAIGWWLFIIGAIGALLAVIGLVFEYFRGEPAA